MTERILRKTTTYELIERTNKPVLDRRTSFTRNRRIIEVLLSLGYRHKQVIPLTDVEYAISNVRGSDPRTIRLALKQLVRSGFLIAVGKTKVQDRKFVTVRTKTNMNFREYSVDKGYAQYSFGPRTPANYQTSLIPPEYPPSNTINECAKQNVCVAQAIKFKVDKHQRKLELGSPNIVKNNNNNNTVLHTHIFPALTAKTEGVTPQNLQKHYSVSKIVHHENVVKK